MSFRGAAVNLRQARTRVPCTLQLALRLVVVYERGVHELQGRQHDS
jgi:hypothetical protein